jgi:hypothetical protein
MLVCVLAAALAIQTDAVQAPLPRSAEPLYPRIDALIAAGYPDYARHAAPLADDAEFLRRIYLDLTGTIPTPGEVREFLADASPAKRARVIDQLLESPGYVRRMAWFWDVTLLERRPDVKVPRAAWEAYLRAVVSANRPYDQFVRDMLTADGSTENNRPAAKFYLERDLEPNLVTRDVARVFLGRNLQCAQCHDHPLVEDYTQDEYYGIQAFLNRSYLFPNAQDPKAVIAEKAEGDVTFVSVFDKARKQNTAAPRMRGRPPLAEPKLEKGKEYKVAPAKNVRPVPTYSRREQLAQALTAAENPAFARTAVNRLWAMLLGRGLVHPLDWDHPENPPSHPELLDLLAREFVAHGYDVKWLLRQIALSATYQRSSAVPATAATVPEDRYLVGLLKPLTPEQLAYALFEATGQTEADRATPPNQGPKPAQVIAQAIDARLAPHLRQFRALFAARPGEPQDGFTATLDQTLFLKHGGTVRNLIGTRVASLLKLTAPAAVAEELFLSILSRRPTAEETQDVAELLTRATDRKVALSELVWALLASTEFRFNH